MENIRKKKDDENKKINVKKKLNKKIGNRKNGK